MTVVPPLLYLAKQLAGNAPRTAMEHAQFARWFMHAPNVEQAISALCEIREAAGAMGDRGHDIYCWAEDALTALGFKQ